MRYLILILALALTANAQPIFGGGGGAAVIIRLNGTTLPATCSGRNLFDLTAVDGVHAKGIYKCDGGTYLFIGPSGEGSYTLPTAAAATLGGVKVGTGLTITDGVLATNPTPTTITGASDAVQLRVTGNATQTNPIAVFEKSDGTDILVVNNDGSVDIGTGGGGWLMTAEAAPATPAAGKGVLYVDSTTKRLSLKDDAGVITTTVPSGTRKRSFGAVFDGGGSALTARSSAPQVIPFACTISAWNIMADAGTATISVWKIARGTAIPTVSDSINTSGVALSSGTAVYSTTLTDFTSTAVTAGDMFIIRLGTVATATQVTASIECDQ